MTLKSAGCTRREVMKGAFVQWRVVSPARPELCRGWGLGNKAKSIHGGGELPASFFFFKTQGQLGEEQAGRGLEVNEDGPRNAA